MSHTTDTDSSLMMNTDSSPVMNILDLPADALRIVFGVADVITDYDDYVLHYPKHWKKLDPIALDATLLCTVGRHICKRLVDIIGGCSPRYTAELAAQANQFSVLSWAISAGYYPDECVDICKFAARNGNLQMLEWAKSRGYTLNKHVAVAAARRGHADVFRYLVDKSPVENHRVITAAMKGGNIQILQNLKRSWDSFYFDEDYTFHIGIFTHIPLASLEWLCANGLTLNSSTLYAAISAKRHDIVEWIISNHPRAFPPTREEKLCGTIACSGSIPILKTLIECGYIRDNHQIGGVYTSSIFANQFHICEYLETNHGMSLQSVGLLRFDSEFLWVSELESTSWMIRKGLRPPTDAIEWFISICVHTLNRLTANEKRESIKEFITLLVENGCYIPPDAPDVFTAASMPEIAEWIRGIM